MSNSDFSKILGKKKEDVEDPKVLPIGHYSAYIEDSPTLGESQKKGTPYARFTFLLDSPQEDVDADAVAALGPHGIRKKDGTPRKMNYDFWFTDETEHQLRDFLNTLGIEWETFGDAFEQVKGKQVVVQIIHEMEDLTQAKPERQAEIAAGAKARTYVKIARVRGA